MCFSMNFQETLIPYSIKCLSSLEGRTVKFAFSIVAIFTTTFSAATILRQEKFPPKLKWSAQSTLKRCNGFSVALSFSEIYPCIFLSRFPFTENVVWNWMEQFQFTEHYRQIIKRWWTSFNISLTRNSWHYSCPRSVYCRSIIFLVVE